MNAPANILAPKVRAADLAQPDEAARLDRFVLAQAAGTPFHRPQWSRAVERATGHRSHYLVAEQGGAILGVLPLSEVRSPLFGASLVSAGFAVGGGILAVSADAADILVERAEGLAVELQCPSIELRGGPLPQPPCHPRASGDPVSAASGVQLGSRSRGNDNQGWHISEGQYAGFVRDLPADEEAILKAIPRKQRAEVRKGLANDLEARFGGDLKAHYRVYAESVRNLGTPVFPRRLFAAMLDEFGADADILVISKEGTPLSTVLSFYQNGTVYPYWGGGTQAARASRANEVLYFALMKHAAARGCTRFDFGRSKLGTGAFAFKKNWGFEPTTLVYAHWGEAREINPLSPKYRLQVAVWKKLPLWLANRAGPVIAKGLG